MTVTRLNCQSCGEWSIGVETDCDQTAAEELGWVSEHECGCKMQDILKSLMLLQELTKADIPALCDGLIDQDEDNEFLKEAVSEFMIRFYLEKYDFRRTREGI